MTVNGPIVDQGKCCWWPWMGTLFLREEVADEIAWAHCWPWEKLTMTLNGPLVAQGICWRWLWMGPLFLRWNVTDVIGWANYCTWEELPMTLNGPIIAIRNTADDSEWANCSSCVWTGKVADDIDWAHCCPRERLPMSSNGPIVVHEKCCWWQWMGPFLPVTKLA